MSIAMHENLLQTIKDVFCNYTELSLGEQFVEGSQIRVNFAYRENPLTLYVFHPDNDYLRNIIVCIDDRIADSLKIPAHYMRYNDKDKRSSLCLLDKEQLVLSTYSLGELVDLYLRQTLSLLSLSARQRELEYLKEFEFYWNAACAENKHDEAEVYIPAQESAALLHCWHAKDNDAGKYVLFPEDVVFNSCSTPKGSKSTALFIPIEYPNGIIPPQKNIPWAAHDLLDIICNQTKDRISPNSYSFLKDLRVDNYHKVVVFSFCQPQSVAITVTGILTFSNNQKKSLIRKIQEDFVSFDPIKSSRMDLKYLHERVGQNHAVLPSVLLIGCGSVGSYILPELVNLGFVNIGISDPDKFESGNSLRHYLGPHSHGINKTAKMQLFMEFENPLVSINVEPNLLDMNDEDVEKVLSKYPMVIVAVGGTDLQRKFNYRFSKINNVSWFLYTWLDAEGKGAHALAMQYSQRGCYNCLFFDHGEAVPRNKVSFSDGSERVIGNGCGGSFSPYGSNVLIRNTSLVLSVLQGILNGSISQNTVASIKNDFSSLGSSISMEPSIITNFSDESCDICGHL